MPSELLSDVVSRSDLVMNSMGNCTALVAKNRCKPELHACGVLKSLLAELEFPAVTTDCQHRHICQQTSLANIHVQGGPKIDHFLTYVSGVGLL